MTPKHNISKLIENYRRSRKWARLAANTRKGYDRHMDYLNEVAGYLDPGKVQRVHVIEMRDTLSEKPTDANRKIGVLSVLMEHAIDIGWIKHNPVKGVDRLRPTGRVRTPWPEDVIEAFRTEADERTLLLFELLLGTGQRVSDVLRLRWSDMDGDGFSLTQGKTKTELFVPLTDRLRSVLAGTAKRSLFLVAQNDGRPLSYQLAWKDIMEVRQRIGAERYDIHGLRYSAASEIASIPGMTSEHVQAITGHSNAAMVRLYAGAAMQRARATEAQSARRDKTRPKRES